MIYSKVRHTFYTGFAGLALIAIASGCSAKSSSANETPAFDDTFFEPTTFTQDNSLPPNLFDTTTAQDPAPTSTSVQYQPVTQQETQCLTNDMSFFGGYSSVQGPTYYTGGQQGACYTQAQPSISFWDMSASMLGAQDYCLNQAIQMIPSTSSSEADIIAAGQAAELIIIRCMRYQYNRASQYGNWNSAQSQVYGSGDYTMYNWMQSYGQ